MKWLCYSASHKFTLVGKNRNTLHIAREKVKVCLIVACRSGRQLATMCDRTVAWPGREEIKRRWSMFFFGERILEKRYFFWHRRKTTAFQYILCISPVWSMLECATKGCFDFLETLSWMKNWNLIYRRKLVNFRGTNGQRSAWTVYLLASPSLSVCLPARLPAENCWLRAGPASPPATADRSSSRLNHRVSLLLYRHNTVSPSDVNVTYPGMTNPVFLSAIL